MNTREIEKTRTLGVFFISQMLWFGFFVCFMKKLNFEKKKKKKKNAQQCLVKFTLKKQPQNHRAEKIKTDTTTTNQTFY